MTQYKPPLSQKKKAGEACWIIFPTTGSDKEHNQPRILAGRGTSEAGSSHRLEERSGAFMIDQVQKFSQSGDLVVGAFARHFLQRRQAYCWKA